MRISCNSGAAAGVLNLLSVWYGRFRAASAALGYLVNVIERQPKTGRARYAFFCVGSVYLSSCPKVTRFRAGLRMDCAKKRDACGEADS
jgi:hypothetical protein